MDNHFVSTDGQDLFDLWSDDELVDNTMTNNGYFQQREELERDLTIDTAHDVENTGLNQQQVFGVHGSIDQVEFANIDYSDFIDDVDLSRVIELSQFNVALSGPVWTAQTAEGTSSVERVSTGSASNGAVHVMGINSMGIGSNVDPLQELAGTQLGVMQEGHDDTVTTLEAYAGGHCRVQGENGGVRFGYMPQETGDISLKTSEDSSRIQDNGRTCKGLVGSSSAANTRAKITIQGGDEMGSNSINKNDLGLQFQPPVLANNWPLKVSSPVDGDKAKLEEKKQKNKMAAKKSRQKKRNAHISDQKTNGDLKTCEANLRKGNAVLEQHLNALEMFLREIKDDNPPSVASSSVSAMDASSEDAIPEIVLDQVFALMDEYEAEAAGNIPDTDTMMKDVNDTSIVIPTTGQDPWSVNNIDISQENKSYEDELAELFSSFK